MSASRKKVVVLAGAGLVVDAGLPMSIQLAARFREYLDGPADGVDEASHSAHRSLYNLIVGGIRFQQGVMDRNPDDPVNIEQIATAALRLGQRHQNPIAPYVSVWHPRLGQIEELYPSALTSFLSAIYGQLRRWLTPAESADLGYLDSLSELRTDRTQLDIFTINYDLCIEKAFTELGGRSFVNGFSEGGWHAELFDETEATRLIKLHGSLDWIDDPHCYGTCSLDYPRHPHAEELEDKTPLLIFGTDQKLTGRDPFLTMFYHFSTALRACAALIVIGYSFSDPHINQIVEQRFRENLGMKMLIVSPHASRQLNMYEWLGNPARTKALDSAAKSAINGKKVLRWFNDVLKEANQELPF